MFKLRRFLVQRSMSPVRIFHMHASVIVLLPKPDICLAFYWLTSIMYAWVTINTAVLHFVTPILNY